MSTYSQRTGFRNWAARGGNLYHCTVSNADGSRGFSGDISGDSPEDAVANFRRTHKVPDHLSISADVIPVVIRQRPVYGTTPKPVREEIL